MNKLKEIILVFLTLISFTISAQELSIGYRAGLGVYNIYNFDLIRDIYSPNNFPLKTTEDFPPHITHRGEIAIHWPSNKAGLFYQFLTTGSRRTLSDYSGAIYSDMVVNINQYGLLADQRIVQFKKLSLNAYLEGGLSFIHIKTTQRFIIYEKPELNNSSYTGYTTNGFFVEPGISFKYRFNLVELQVNSGYQFIRSGQLKYENGKDSFLVKSIDMSGFRAGFQINYFILRNK